MFAEHVGVDAVTDAGELLLAVVADTERMGGGGGRCQCRAAGRGDGHFIIDDDGQG